jgi:hypothetical protein
MKRVNRVHRCLFCGGEYPIPVQEDGSGRRGDSNMKTIAVVLLAMVAGGLLALSLGTADAHLSVPQYDGNEWGVRCLAASGGRVTAEGCCHHSRGICDGACGLASNVPDTWKNSCRANCQAAGTKCLARIKPRPPVTNIPGTAPPARDN